MLSGTQLNGKILNNIAVKIALSLAENTTPEYTLTTIGNKRKSTTNTS